MDKYKKAISWILAMAMICVLGACSPAEETVIAETIAAEAEGTAEVMATATVVLRAAPVKPVARR